MSVDACFITMYIVCGIWFTAELLLLIRVIWPPAKQDSASAEVPK